MRHALYRKAKADILGRPFTTLLLGLVIAVGAATLAMTLTVNRSTSTSYEAFLEEARGGHVWVFSSLALLDEVARTGPGIAAAGDPMPSLDDGRMLGASAEHRLSFFGVGAEPPAVTPALIVEGGWPEEGSNQAVIDRGFARAEELAIGDVIRVTASGGVTALQIVGLHVPTNLAPYPAWTTSSVFVSPDLVADLGGGAPAYYSAGYELIDPDRSAAFVQALAIRFRDSPPSMRDWQEIRAVVIEENEQTFFLLGSFAFFALLAALFIIANAVAGQVQSQLRDIGLLKAIGVTPRQVTLLFVLELTLIALVASGLGVILGWWITPLFLVDLEEMLGLPAPVSPNVVELAATIGVATSISALAALTAGWRAGGASATASIVGRSRALGRRPSRLASVAGRIGLPRVVVFGLKDVFARPVRAWLTIAAVAVAAAAMGVTLTMEQLLSNVFSNPQIIGVLPNDLWAERVTGGAVGDQTTEISDGELVTLVQSYEEVERYMTRKSIDVVIDMQTFRGLGIGGEYAEYDYPLVEGRVFRERGEAIMGLGLARWLGVSIGDKKLVRLFDRDGPSRVMTIVGIYIEGTNNGRALSFSLEDLQRAAPEINAGAYGLEVRDGIDLDALTARLVADTAERVTVIDLEARLGEEVQDLRETLRPILIALSGFLFALVTVSLLSSLTLSVRERTREIGMLRAIGFTPWDVVASVVAGAIALSFVGAVVGAPLGWLFARLIVHEPFSSQGYDVSQIVRPLSPWWFAVIIVAMTFAAVAGSVFPAWHATRLRISDALRYE